MVRAQFIVPLQPSYNQQIQNYYKIIYDTLCIYFAFKYFLAFWGIPPINIFVLNLISMLLLLKYF